MSEPQRPALPAIHRFPDGAALAEGAADWLATELIRAIAARGQAGVALAGGTTPRAMHAHLAIADRTPAIDWSAVRIYFGDERCVPLDDPASNYRMARESLLDHVAVPEAQVFRIEGERVPAEAARRYHGVLAAAPTLDVIVLGMGEDGHVASWFPGEAAFGPGALAAATTSPVAPRDRITITRRTMATAGAVIVVVSGEAKARRLAQVHAQLVAAKPVLPAARVTSAGGPPHWFIDDAAASALPRPPAPELEPELDKRDEETP